MRVPGGVNCRGNAYGLRLEAGRTVFIMDVGMENGSRSESRSETVRNGCFFDSMDQKAWMRMPFYRGWSESEGTYSAMSHKRQSRIRHRSLSVVVFMGLFFRSLSIVALDI